MNFCYAVLDLEHGYSIADNCRGGSKNASDFPIDNDPAESYIEFRWYQRILADIQNPGRLLFALHYIP